MTRSVEGRVFRCEAERCDVVTSFFNWLTVGVNAIDVKVCK